MMARKHYESPLFTALLFFIIVAGFAAIALDPFGPVVGSSGTVSWDSLSPVNQLMIIIGLIMLVAGVVIRFIAMATLKMNFSGLLRIREGHTLVTNGIYHWIRHPAYLGAILIFLAFPIMLSSPLGFMVMFLLVPYLMHRITLEEKMLVEHFGSEYQEYMKTSKRLIPFLY
jgi:protein-S-isoprenylcysteine O-methyltransferase Ste14